VTAVGQPARRVVHIKPAGQVDLQAIAAEQANIDRIVATLGLKEMTQGTLVRKLCTYDANPTRWAIFDYDRLVRSIYTLRYLRDPKLQSHVQRSQTRIESYHQLRSASAPRLALHLALHLAQSPFELRHDRGHLNCTRGSDSAARSANSTKWFGRVESDAGERRRGCW